MSLIRWGLVARLNVRMVGAIAVSSVMFFGRATEATSYTVSLDSFQSTAAFPSDTRASGSATFVPNSTLASPDGNGSVQLVTINGTDSQEKAAPFFYNGTLFTPLGTLGDLGRGSFTADWDFISRGANTPSFVADVPAFRILVGVGGSTPSGFAELIWEDAYQSTHVSPSASPGTWIDDLNLGSGKYYARWNGGLGGENTFEGSGKTLADWALGLAGPGPHVTNGANAYPVVFSANMLIYGAQTAIGSGAGDYTGYVDDLKMAFVGIPEPSSMVLLLVGSLLCWRARRRRV